MNRLICSFASLFLLYSFQTIAQSTFPVNGVKDEKKIVYAFTNATLFVDYKTKLDTATLIIQDGKVIDAGKNISVPRGAVVQDMKGKFIYPSFIDIYSDYGMPESKKKKDGGEEGRGSPQMLSNTKGAYNWNQAIRPEKNAKEYFSADSKKAEELRKLGFGAVSSHVKDGIARGTSVFATLADDKENKVILKDQASAHYSFDKGTSTQDYPGSLMGAIALIRQTYLDAEWYRHPANEKEVNLSLDAWNKSQNLPQVFESGDKLSSLRADRIAREFGVKYILKGSGDEYQRISDLKATGSAFIVPLNFPSPFDVEDPYDALQVSLGEMKHWEAAPSNAAALQKAGIPFAITASDLKEQKEFMKNLRKAVEAGLSEQDALKALTYTPAQLLKMENRIGSLNKGMIANFIISSKNIFDKESILFENWVQGKQYKQADLDLKDIRGNYELKIGPAEVIKLKAGGEFTEPAITLELDTAKADSNKVKVNFSRLMNLVSLQFELKRGNKKGQYRLSGYLEGNDWKGKGQLPDGQWIDWSAKYISEFVPEPKKDTVKKDLSPGELFYPNKAYGWKELPKQETYLLRNASVWTNEKEGIVSDADVLIQSGKIAKFGKGLAAPAGAKIIDATGKHISPGIVDEHSHIAISRGVNEGTQAITSEVRIGDVVNSDDVNIYRQLAGGVTTSHLLHGSANPVGGQTILIKLRWGLAPEKMKFEGADGFIKFALGENVKQSNWGDRNMVRFPQTRMGVEQVFYDGFTRAKEYDREWKKYLSLSDSEKKSKLPPRKDLEVEALLEILNKKRFITCHSYVQSEINMLMHVADSMGFKVNTFTHILEGYKVADKMKNHGVAASSFADWWGYKYEVIEAIPHNGAILHHMGVLTGFNSDDAEMARRLNQEAAKAVKYGNVSEEEALKFVTLNPAKMLHVDHRIGSIREGKDADIVIWSDNPLSMYARAEKTFVDGILYYDTERDLKLRDEINKERSRIISKMLEAKKSGEKAQKPKKQEENLYHCDSLEGYHE